MIIKCEKCESRFNIDERILKKDGSKVRCSICKNIFTAFPPKSRPIEETDEDDLALVDTAEMDKLPVKGAARTESEDEGMETALINYLKMPWKKGFRRLRPLSLRRKRD